MNMVIDEALLDGSIEKSIENKYRSFIDVIVKKLKRRTVTQHWAFARAMNNILPYAMEFISVRTASCHVNIPTLNCNEPGIRPKPQLSGAVTVSVHDALILDNRRIEVPLISFNKYSHSATDHPIKEVAISDILSELDLWQRGHKVNYKKPMDFIDLTELAILVFMDVGFKIYSGVSFNQAGRRYYRIAFIKEDMFVEMILTMDDFFAYKDLSDRELTTRPC